MSKFGSHKSMVDKKATANLGDQELVVCRDEYGIYVTKTKSLDNGLADYNRFNQVRMKNHASPDKDWVH